MHLEGPWLSTVGRRKGKVKYKSAEAKKQALALEREWEARKQEYQRMSKPVSKPVKNNSMKENSFAVPAGRETPRIASLNSWVTGAVSSKPNQQYTGDNVIGVTILHKSCLQPVFTKQEAIDSARMRRG